jgi:hypothetical protein
MAVITAPLGFCSGEGGRVCRADETPETEHSDPSGYQTEFRLEHDFNSDDENESREVLSDLASDCIKTNYLMCSGFDGKAGLPKIQTWDRRYAMLECVTKRVSKANTVFFEPNLEILGIDSETFAERRLRSFGEIPRRNQFVQIGRHSFPIPGI